MSDGVGVVGGIAILLVGLCCCCPWGRFVKSDKDDSKSEYSHSAEPTESSRERYSRSPVSTPTTASASAIPTQPPPPVTPPSPEPVPTVPVVPVPPKLNSELAGIVEAPEGDDSTYARALFKHWIKVSGECDTREWVLKRQGIGTVQDANCKSVAGSWTSPYDGASWTATSDVDIDHLVPLAEAWRSGASSWSAQKRQEFANDITRPQLFAVTDHVNQAKSDKDPASWQPPLQSYHCKYARNWVAVKLYWGLTAQQSEKIALSQMLATC